MQYPWCRAPPDSAPAQLSLVPSGSDDAACPGSASVWTAAGVRGGGNFSQFGARGGETVSRLQVKLWRSVNSYSLGPRAVLAPVSSARTAARRDQLSQHTP